MDRYEKKYKTNEIYLPQILSQIRINPAGFSEVFKERVVNSIYFDSNDFQLYNDSIDGSLKRTKLRIRWYDNEKIINSFLEIKKKVGDRGDKFRYNLKPIKRDKEISKDYLKDLLKKSNIEDKNLLNKFDYFNPIFICSYNRKYFLSSNKQIRLTVDYQISYSSFSYEDSLSNLNKFYDSSLVIEYKYPYYLNSKFFISENILNLRRTRFSKFSNGIQMLYS